MFSPEGRCLNIAVDHGVFNEYTFLDGLEDMAGIVESLIAAGPDAIQMNYGQAELLQANTRKPKPALVMRIDVGNPYNSIPHRYMFNTLQDPGDPITKALRLDAACVVCNLLLLPDEPDLHRQTVQNVGIARNVCDQYGMPLMVEPLVMRPASSAGAYQVDGTKELIVPLVRQARELGADVIKADPTANPEDYHEVIDAARCPVLVRGGGKEDLDDVFEKAAAFIGQGANGLVYGRNIYQHPNPAGVTAALLAVIHHSATATEARRTYDSFTNAATRHA